MSRTSEPLFSAEFDVVDLSGGDSTGEEAKSHRCVDCGAQSPPARTNFTLISSRYGWRLHRERDDLTRSWRFEWRCPSCWAQFRETRRLRFSSGPPLGLAR